MILFKRIIHILATLLLIAGCEKAWDDYYYTNEEPTVNENMWEEISKNPEFSKFVDYVINTGADSLFTNGNPITVFIPNNTAFEDIDPDSFDIQVLIDYHFIETVINIQNITKSSKLETISGKYTLIENFGNDAYIDGTKIVFSSSLYMNGRFYAIEEVLQPSPTIYELVSQTNPILRDYIDQFDSVYLDVSKSKPVGYDEEGNTVYDSVFTRINLFDSLYFPISEEFRSQSVTFVLFDQQQYINALDEMALDLGSSFQSYSDIPREWQMDVLLPIYVDERVFGGTLQFHDFQEKMKNIVGDSVYMDYLNIDPESRLICSNGVIYKYNNFSVPDSLYSGEIKMQGEDLLELIAPGVYGWKEGVNISGTSKSPSKVSASSADNDTLINLELGTNYEEDMMLEFFIPDILPQRYRLVWSANYRPSGEYEVYVNDELIGTIDLFDMRSTQISVTGEYFVPEGGINRKDFWVENINEYGDVKIGIKYIGKGFSNFNGFSIDYMSLIPDGE